MNNKLGINREYDLKEIEYYLFNIKYHLIDENFNFNLNSIFSIEYLEKLHSFLFEDVYDSDYCKLRKDITEEGIKDVNNLLNHAQLLMNEYDANTFSEIIYKIWENQLFYDGNTRTLLCFVKVVSNIYNLDIKYDFEKNIDKDYFINEIVDAISHEKRI